MQHSLLGTVFNINHQAAKTQKTTHLLLCFLLLPLKREREKNRAREREKKRGGRERDIVSQSVRAEYAVL